MLFVDASVIIAIIAQEEDWLDHVQRLEQAGEIHTSPLAIWEAAVGLVRIRQCSVADATALVQDLLQELDAVSVPITDEIGRLALDAYDRYGRGRHAADLNFGDCFAYACAAAHSLELAYKGKDFSRTDLGSNKAR